MIQSTILMFIGVVAAAVSVGAAFASPTPFTVGVSSAAVGFAVANIIIWTKQL